MNTIRLLSDEELETRTEKLADESRRITSELLAHLLENDRRMLYLKRGYHTLDEYLRKGLKFSEDEAYRRRKAVELLRDVPDAKAAIEQGEVSLSTAVKVQQFVSREHLDQGKIYTGEQKKELLESVKKLSLRDCERKLAEISPESAQPRREQERFLAGGDVEIRFTASWELSQKLERLKELLAHRNPNPTYSELFEALAEMGLQRLDPLLKKPKPTQVNSAPASPSESSAKDPQGKQGPTQREPGLASPSGPSITVPPAKQKSTQAEPSPAVQPKPSVKHPEKQKHSNPSYIPRPIYVKVMQRDGGACKYRDPKSGRVCGSRYGVEVDHVLPAAQGGKSVEENLRCLCRRHNLFAAVQAFGVEHMSEYLPGLRVS